MILINSMAVNHLSPLPSSPRKMGPNLNNWLSEESTNKSTDPEKDTQHNICGRKLVLIVLVYQCMFP